jgi:rfaE bifunctional protein nucleotidyltransferase chain/domain
LGLNDDESVHLLKGPGRPLVKQDDRAAVLGALRCVDHVVVFSGLLPNEMLERLRPDVHCKAADYTPESMPETEIVRKHGGRVAILPLQDGYATSKIISRATSPERSPADTAAAPKPDDFAGWTIATMLDASNSFRRAAYELGAKIAAAAGEIARSWSAGGRLWIFAEAQFAPSAAGIAVSFENAGRSGRCPAAVLTCGPSASGDEALAAVDHIRDLLLCVIDAPGSALVRKLLEQARDRHVRTIIIQAVSRGPHGAKDEIVLAVEDEDPACAGILQAAVLHALARAAGRVLESRR